MAIQAGRSGTGGWTSLFASDSVCRDTLHPAPKHLMLRFGAGRLGKGRIGVEARLASTG